MKQETLKEAASIFSKQFLDNGNNSEFEAQASYLGFIQGAKWQQEQDKNKFSEEDMHKLMDEYQNWLFNSEDVILTFREWFEKSKNK